MHDINNKYICIAGKNSCAINFLKYISKKIEKKYILSIPNKTDKGIDSWQPSFKKYIKKKNYKIVSLKDLYKIENLIFISIEYEKIINVKKFKTKELFNFHFSLLPKYRGCHTNFHQIYNNEKYTGVTLHKIDKGIDTGKIISKIKYKIHINHNALENYVKLMKYSLKLLKKEFINILNKKYILKVQKNDKSSYFSRNSVNYDKMKKMKLNRINKSSYNKIRAFIFPPYQLPIVNSKVVKNIKYKNKKILISYG